MIPSAPAPNILSVPAEQADSAFLNQPLLTAVDYPPPGGEAEDGKGDEDAS